MNREKEILKEIYKRNEIIKEQKKILKELRQQLERLNSNKKLERIRRKK